MSMDENTKTEKTERKPSIAKKSIEDELRDIFFAEFVGMPYDPISVVIRVGNMKSPTYQEIEVPPLAKFLADIIKG